MVHDENVGSDASLFAAGSRDEEEVFLLTPTPPCSLFVSPLVTSVWVVFALYNRCTNSSFSKTSCVEILSNCSSDLSSLTLIDRRVARSSSSTCSWVEDEREVDDNLTTTFAGFRSDGRRAFEVGVWKGVIRFCWTNFPWCRWRADWWNDEKA